MATTYKSIPVFLSGYGVITGYTCPTSKTAIIKQISLSNESPSGAFVDIKWCERNSVGIGTTTISNNNFYPVVISGGVSGFSVRSSLQEFLTLQGSDFLTFRTAETGRINAIITIIEQEIT